MSSNDRGSSSHNWVLRFRVWSTESILVPFENVPHLQYRHEILETFHHALG